jgi:hypothetical protein
VAAAAGEGVVAWVLVADDFSHTANGAFRLLKVTTVSWGVACIGGLSAATTGSVPVMLCLLVEEAGLGAWY